MKAREAESINDPWDDSRVQLGGWPSLRPRTIRAAGSAVDPWDADGGSGTDQLGIRAGATGIDPDEFDGGRMIDPAGDPASDGGSAIDPIPIPPGRFEGGSIIDPIGGAA
jgi:hypothetical protein